LNINFLRKRRDRIMEETGIVISTQGIMAKVLIQRRGACEGCAVAGTCKPSGEIAELEAFNPIKAKVGETVRIAMRPQLYLKTSLIVYGLPAATLIGGAILGKKIGELYFKGMDSDIMAAIFGFVAFAISFLAIKFWVGKMGKKEEYRPVIEEVIQT